MSSNNSPTKLKNPEENPGGVGEGDIGQEAEGKRKFSPRYDFGKRWHHFRVLTPHSFILRGSHAMNNPRFKYRSRGRQAAPCSVVAIVYGRLFEPKKWTTDYIDQVLEYGDKLFRVSATRNRLKNNEYMKTGLVHNEFYVGFYKILVGIEDSGIRGNLFSESIGCSDFAEGLRRFLRDNDAGVITAQGNSVAVWRQSPDVFFYYDSAACDENGLRRPGGAACLMRFKNINDLREHLLKNLDRRYDSRYCIDKIDILRVTEVGQGFIDRLPGVVGPPLVQKNVLRSINPEDVDEHKVDCTKPVPKDEKLHTARIRKEPLFITISNYSIDRRFATEPLVNRNNFDTGYTYDDMRVNVPSTFKELPNKMAILHGLTHEGSEVYKGKGGQNVANCVMAIAMNKIHPVKTWLKPKLDEILELGDALYARVKSEKPALKTMTAADLDDTRLQIEDRKLVVSVDLITVTGTINSKLPSVLNLRQAVEEFFLVNKEGVIETTSLTVAVWSQNDCYYLFDPRARDATGVQVKEELAAKPAARGKREEIAHKIESGHCCVIRFPNLNSLVALFLRNVDPAKKNDRFTIRHVAIVDDVPGTRAWNEFQPGVAGETWVLRGSTSNVDESFEEENQGLQGLAMPVVALVSASETPPAKWSGETIDEAVREGNNYYNWTKRVETEEETELPFLVQHLKKNLYFKNRKVTIDIEEATVVGDIAAPEDSEVPNLERGMRQFFENKQCGIVELKRLAVAVWKVEEEINGKNKDKAKKQTFYYYFDPNPRDKLGQLSAEKNEDNFACVVRTSNLSALANLIKRNAGQDAERENDFTIHELKNVSVGAPMTDAEIEADKLVPIMPDLNNYSSLGNNGALLLGSIDQKNETVFKRQTRDRQQAANSLATLAMTKLYNPHLWYREMVDDILKIGDKLTTENLVNLPEAEEDVSPRNYLLPSEIEVDFVIGVNRMSIGLEEETVTGNMTDVTRLLAQFFVVNAMGVFRQNNVIMPIWKEGNVFFTMDPRGRNAQGEPRDKDGAAAVMWFADIASLANVLRQVAQGDNFVIDAVSVENAYETRVAEAQRVKKTTSADDLWHHFPKLANGVWSIDGDVAVTDERFDEENRGKQSAAVAAIAVVFSKVYQPRYWTPSILDEIIITGDKLHSKCVERLGAGSVPLINEIISEFFLSNRRIALTIKDCVQAGSLNGRPPKVQDLQSGIDNFFDKYDAGALTGQGNRNLAIWKANNALAYYALIPDWSSEGTVVPRVFRFRDTSLLVEYLLRHFGRVGDYQIAAIDVLDSSKLPPWKVDPSPAIRPANLPPLNAYKRLQGEARAILRGGYHQGDEIFSETLRNRQSAANCIVALGMSVVKCPVTWTKKTMDEILAIGSGVHQETRKARPTKFRLKPSDIVRVFHVGVNVLTADVESDTVTGLVAIAPPDPEEEKKKKVIQEERKHKVERDREKVQEIKQEEASPPSPSILLEEGLRKFFQDNRAGILVTDRGMIAIWKDQGVYFMYDPRARSDQGLPDPRGTSCVMWFACMEPLYDVIFANINPQEKYGSFEICRVIVKTAVIEPLPSPAGFRTYFDRDTISGPITSKRITTLKVEPLCEYKIVDDNLSVLLGSLHMNHRTFSLKNRGLQSTAIAAVAIIVGLLHVPSTWTPELIDAVLKYGDALHSDSVRAARASARNLSPSELLTVFIVGDIRATIHIHNHTTAGILHAFDLAEALAMFFRTNCAGILHTTNLAVAVMQHYGKFYMFDPCPRNNWGRLAYDGAACVFRCDSIAKMAKIFVANCNLRRPNVYTLNAVNVLNLHFFSDARTVCPSKSEE